MKKISRHYQNIWKIEELRGRNYCYPWLLLVYRFGARLVLPGLDSTLIRCFGIEVTDSGILGILNAFTGGALSMPRFLRLGLCLYFCIYCCWQLMGNAFLIFKNYKKEGESGRKSDQIK